MSRPSEAGFNPGTSAQVLRPIKEDRTPVRRLYEWSWNVLDAR